ncbi:MAG TPA: EAL domain-containing protein [Acidimicrobiales bacterium]|nr:EAL domain-containing protein [Acidimicrobiales bacterium]
MATGIGGPRATHLVTRVLLLLASIAATAACAAAAGRSRGGARRGWTLFSLTAACWVMSQALALLREVLTGRLLPLPAPADVPSALAIVLSVLGLLAFLGSALSSAARMRALLDGLLISSSLLFVSWAVVLDDLYRATGDGPARVLALAYPMGDVVLATLVLVAIARVDRKARLPWTLLGAGLALFAMGHSVFAYLQLGRAETPASLQAVAWMAGCLLVGLAAVASDARTAPTSGEARAGGRFGIFVPYAPLLLTAAVLVSQPRDRWLPPFLAANGAVILLLLLGRQILAQLENLELAHGLESRVRSRTAELDLQQRRFRSIAQNASDVLTVIDAAGTVRYQSPSVSRVLGYRPEDLLERSLEGLIHRESYAAVVEGLRTASPPPAAPAVVHARLRRADGTSCLVEMTISNLLDDDAVQGLVITSRDISERAALEHQLRHQALHDPLTGLANRTLFLDRLEHAVARSKRRPEMLAVLMVDLDGFKQVNDSLGHGAGDRLLVEVARRLADSVREGDTVARMGGDEFAVLIERADLEGPAVVAKRIAHRLRAPVHINGKAIVSQGSVGVAMGSSSSLRAEELLRNADLAMYVAKGKGKGVCEIFAPEMHEAALQRVELEADLREALRSRNLTLHYQPVVELPGGRISGVEALARWHHPERGLVSPAEFVPLAEESGLVVDLGRWVLQEACRQAKRFQLLYPTQPPFTMAVNVAARQLASPFLVDEVRKALEDNDLDPASLVLEITEGALLNDASTILPTLEAVKALGVQLAIDDFGTGWSSLSRLRSFPVDKLKIDRSFIQEITAFDDEAPIVAAIVAMAHSLRLSTVAEGVETMAQLACLHLHGCEEVQGFLLSRPLTEDALIAVLADPGGLLESAVSPAGQLSQAGQDFMGLVAETASQPDGTGDAVRLVLAEIRRVTGAASVYLTEIDASGLTQWVRHSTDTSGGLCPGVRLPLLDSPCDRMLQGGPRYRGDIRGYFAEHPLVGTFGVAGHATVPLCRGDGTVYGTLCAATPHPGTVDHGTAVLLELFAGILIEHLDLARAGAELLAWPSAS